MQTGWTRSAALILFVLLPGFYGTAYAQSVWTTRSEAGYVLSRGNTDTQTANAKVEVGWRRGQWRYSYGLGVLYGNSNGVRTAQRWDTRFEVDHKLTERAFWFAGLRYEDDAFSGFVYQYSFAAGAGYDFLKSDRAKLSAQLGVGIRRLRPELLVRDDRGAVVQRVPGEQTDDGVGNASLSFEYALTPTTKVLDTALVESGQSNTMTQNNLALQMKVNASFALAIGLTVRRNSSPPAPLGRTDTLTTLNLVYHLNDPHVST